MKPITLLFFSLIFFSCKETPQMEDFPLNVTTPLIDGDPLIISWNLAGADSLKLDNDLFLKSDTACFYVVGKDAVRVRVFKKDEVIYEKYIRYKVEDGEKLADVEVVKKQLPVQIPLNYLGVYFPLRETIPLLGTGEKTNTILINLLKNLYDKTKRIPITITKSNETEEPDRSLEMLNHFAHNFQALGYQVEYSIELPEKKQQNFLDILKKHLNDQFVSAIIIDWDKADEATREAVKKMNRPIITTAGTKSITVASAPRLHEVNLEKWVNCETKDPAALLNPELFAKTLAQVTPSDQHSNIVHLTLPSCSKTSNTFESSLWLLDYLLNSLQNGVVQVNINIGNQTISNRPYAGSPFLFEIPRDHVTRRPTTKKTDLFPEEYLLKSVQSPYYAMWMFSDLLEEGNKLQSMSVDSTKSNIKAYGVLTAANKMKFVLINKELSKSGRVFIKDTSIRRAWSTRLTVPQYSGVNRLIYGGRTFDASTDGEYSGTYYTDKVAGRKTGNRIGMPAASAAIVQAKH